MEGDFHALLMALIKTTIVPVLTVEPWTDPSGPGLPGTPQPMAELIANSKDAAVALSGAGDTQEIAWDITLPVNFVYILTDISVNVLGTGLPAVITWDALAFCQFLGSGREYSIGLKSSGPSQIGANSSMSWTNDQVLPNWLIVGGGTWVSRFSNAVEEEIGVTFNATARFLQYSIAQRFDSRINTPQLTR